MNYQEIKEKHPKAYNAFDHWLSNVELPFPPIWDYLTMAFEMQSGVLERFFDEQGLFFEVYMELGLNHKEIRWGIPGWNAAMTGCATRSEAQLAAFNRAFEILESKLTSPHGG